MSIKNSQAGNSFLSEVFSRADPDPVGDLLARHDTLLQRVTKLERAIEKALVKLEDDGGMFRDVRKSLQRALDG